MELPTSRRRRPHRAVIKQRPIHVPSRNIIIATRFPGSWSYSYGRLDQHSG